MSDDIEIRHGAVVAVDSSSLREAAAVLGTLHDRFAAAATAGRQAAWAFGEVDAVLRRGWARDTYALVDAVERVDAAAAGVVDDLCHAADVYEHAELTARRATLTDEAQLAAIDARLAQLSDSAGFAASMNQLGYDLRAPWEFIGQTARLGWLIGPGAAWLAGGSAYAMSSIVRGVGLGHIPASRPVAGPAQAVTVTPVVQHTAARVTPVASLAEMTNRIPQNAAVRVEQYTMPDGTNEYVVYTAGTGAGSAFDMESNTQLYSGERSASYDAVRDALTQSGAQPGDVVHTAGHSQGAMVNAYVAIAGEYDVQTVVSAGSPVQAELPASTLSVELRHTDDVVSTLADGGSASGVGSPDSIIVERVADPVARIGDLKLPAHGLDAYAHTAALADASADPRIDTVQARFAHLGEATAVAATEYSAERPVIVSDAHAAGAG